ncbi:hypothetical protein ABZZ17_28110 [Streptomyces sp. NPDC006512]|uniref:hypothetical protein n=1 Tax=Streptomyces sp. NPDC006512 TaxID=3154307 RepID=UPI0033BB4A24
MASHDVGRPPGRAVGLLGRWWMASPACFVAAVLVGAFAQTRYLVDEWALAALVWAGLGGLVLAPAVGLGIALFGGRRDVLRRFAVMGAVSAVAVLLFFAFWEFASECPDGYHC